jgi:hypothetical protein
LDAIREIEHPNAGKEEHAVATYIRQSVASKVARKNLRREEGARSATSINHTFQQLYHHVDESKSIGGKWPGKSKDLSLS